MTVAYLSAVIFYLQICWTRTVWLAQIPDWHIVNVTGMWILHPVYAIHLAHGIVDFTGMEAQRRSFSNACKRKDSINRFLPPAVSAHCVFSACVTLHSRSNDLSWRTQITVTISNKKIWRLNIYRSGTCTWWSSRNFWVCTRLQVCYIMLQRC